MKSISTYDSIITLIKRGKTYFKRITKRTKTRINQYITAGVKTYVYICTCKLKDRRQELLLAPRGCRNIMAKGLEQGPGRRALPSPPTQVVIILWLICLIQHALWFLCFQLSLLLWYKKGNLWHILTKNLWVSELLLYLVTFKKFVCPVSSIEIVY